jgi:hypothetical protein
VCGFCRQPIHGVYYQVGDRVACERCRADVEIALGQGSGPSRFLRASLYGTGAGAVGAGIWYAIRALTDYEIGIIAILVGFMVGAAVRKGSNGRGGWLYQTLAVVLTYAAIVSTYVPFILKGMLEGPEGSPTGPAPGLLGIALVAVVVFAIACAAPFLGGFENIVGIFIIAIGLYEAWKINRRLPIPISGPFRVGALPAPEAGV